MADRRVTPNTPQPDGRRASDQAYGSTSGSTRRELYERQIQAMLLERTTFHAAWQELADQMAPRRLRLHTTDRNQGQRKDRAIIDTTPRTAARTLQSGLHAGITSPARPWFRLTTPDPALAEQPEVKAWLHTVTQRLHTVFLRSNLYNALPILYGDLGVFGTGAMAILEDSHDLLRAYAYPLGSYVFGLDSRGIASYFAREYRLTVNQLVEEFGPVDGDPREIDWSRFSVTVKDLYYRGDGHAPVDIYWYVQPNRAYNPAAFLARDNKRFSSCWFEAGRDAKDYQSDARGFLRESGFRQFPVLCPRWEVAGEDTYGTESPGWVALGDARQLQGMEKKKAKAIDKAIDPPVKGSNALKNQKVSLLPGDITYVDELGQNALAPVHEVRLEGLQFLQQDMLERRARVERAFFADLFLMLAQSDQVQPITAEEVRVRQEEKLIQLGPVLERLNDELLDPLIDRSFDLLNEWGAIPRPPESLEGVELKVEYISIMAQAQKLVGVVGQDRFAQTVMAMSEKWPEVLHKVKATKYVEKYADQLGVDPALTRDEDETEQRIAAAEQMAAAQLEAERLKTVGQGLQALGNTPMSGGGTALEDVMGGAVAGSGGV